MSAKTAIPLADRLVSTFRAALTPQAKTRFLVVAIRAEELVLEREEVASVSLQHDWKKIASVAADNAPKYVLVRLEPKRWVSILFIPQSASVRDKMTTAATKAQLLESLGYEYFVDELQAESELELSWTYYCNNKAPETEQEAIKRREDYMTPIEKQQRTTSQDEAKEAKWRAEQFAQKRATMTVSSPAELGGGGGSTLERRCSMGGYHSVTLPFTPDAERMVRDFAANTVQAVELKISATKDKVEGSKTGNPAVSALSSFVNTAEPRFYLFRSSGTCVFVYSCPDRSPPSLRMVYSTGKGSVANAVASLGVVAASKEISDASDASNELFQRAPSSLAARPYSGRYNPGSAPSINVLPEGGGQVRAASLGQVAAPENPHPIYSLMGKSNRRSKRIVIPPKGAY